MTKNLFNWMLVAALVCGLCLSVTSCKDDDDEKSENLRADIDPLDNEESQAAFRWLCALADAEKLDANWKSKTYEPTVGQPSENNEYTRVIVVNDLEEAQQDFASFADKNVDELGSKVTVDGGAAGTMTWEPSGAGAANLAVVDVKSAIMPHLQKLIYCTQEQTGQNGFLFGNSMKGTPYYRFGDVIQDSEGYYWVCVRPCFAANPEDKTGYKDTKGDCHWINIFNAAKSGNNKGMPDANVKRNWNKLDKYDGQTILLPTDLAYDREHIFNLTQLIWALLRPAEYKDMCDRFPKSALGGFPYIYHGENFVKSVAEYWNSADDDGYTIWQKLFNHTYDEMKTLQEIDFLYNGYSWMSGNSGYVWRYSSRKYAKKCMESVSFDKEKFDFVKDGFDVTHFAQTPDSEPKPWKNFKENKTDAIGHWVVRYKRGDKLMTGGKFDYYKPIASADGPMKDVYRYNEEKGIEAGATEQLQKDTDSNSIND